MSFLAETNSCQQENTVFDKENVKYKAFEAMKTKKPVYRQVDLLL